MATVVDSQGYSQALLFKWEVLQLSFNVNRWRSHRIVMITLIISEALDLMTGALEELWFAAHS